MSEDIFNELMKDVDEFATSARGGKEADFLARKMSEAIGTSSCQELFASCCMYRLAKKDEGYPLCRIDVRNESDSQRIMFCNANVLGKDVAIRYLVDPGETTYIVKLGKYIGEDIADQGSTCSMVVNDQYTRRLCSEKGFVLFSGNGKAPKFSLDADIDIRKEISVNDDGDAVIADLRLVSKGIDSIACTVGYTVNGHSSSIVCTATESGKDIHLTAMSYMIAGKDECDITIDVISECSGKRSFKGKAKIVIQKKDSAPAKVGPAPKKKVFAEAKMLDIIDVNEITDGHVVLGAIAVGSAENEPFVCKVTVRSEGKGLMSVNVPLQAGKPAVVPLYATPDMIASDITRKLRFDIFVEDDNDNIIAEFHEMSDIRSRFDLDRDQLIIRTAQFVNPYAKEVKELVDKKDGILSRCRKDKSITGYQDPDKIIDQLSAVFATVRDLGLHYVSDMFTLIGTIPYQRVRTPSAVISDGSGNCFDLSVLFASILESMCFEPALLFTEEHVMVGIVVKTDAYPSISKEPNPKMPTFSFTDQNGKCAEILPFESTACTYAESTFEGAVNSVFQTLTKSKVQSICLVRELRSKGVNPLMM